MAHMNIMANKGTITIQIDAYWDSFYVNGQMVVPPGSGVGNGSVTFSGKFFGSPSMPTAAMAFASGTGATAELWLAVVTFANAQKPGFCDIAGTVLYGDAAAMATALSPVIPVTVTVAKPGTTQPFSAYGLTGTFSVTA